MVNQVQVLVQAPLTEKPQPDQGPTRFELLVGAIFEALGCVIFGYAVCDSEYYASNNRSNTGSFFVSYGLFLAILLTSDFSGGHYNYAVTLGLWIKKGSGVTVERAIAYLIPQFLGFFLGGMLAWGFQDRIVTPLQPSQVLAVQDFFAEILGTFMFVFMIIFFTSDITPVKSKLGKMFIIPFMLFIFRTWAFRTQSLNPTLALGLGVADGIKSPSDWSLWNNSWVVVAGPLIGGVLAPLFFDYFYRRLYLQMMRPQA